MKDYFVVCQSKNWEISADSFEVHIDGDLIFYDDKDETKSIFVKGFWNAILLKEDCDEKSVID